MDALKELLIHDKKVNGLIGSEFEIHSISNKFNIIYELNNSKVSVYAKIGFRGWSKSEWNVLKLLYKKGFIVPKPIHYISLSNVHIKNWKFGNLEQENGIVFYEPLQGKILLDELNLKNIKGAYTLLKKFHDEIDFESHVIPQYQEFEVERGLKYAREIYSGSKLERIEDRLKSYADLKITTCFIHGDARIEHFVINEDGIGMIDFEGACNGDPFKDFGIFQADLALHEFNGMMILEDVLGRELTDSEKIRLEFFELRKYLVSIRFEGDEESKKMVDKIIN
ncbi:MAG: aminoglycoside phosphotransferase family protein [Candidatus Helarchaeota archaeon]